jgi:hypothetical protein
VLLFPNPSRSNSDVVCRQELQPRPIAAPAGDEPCARGVEHELEHLPLLAPHLNTPALVVHRQHGPSLDPPAEVQDPCPGADTG